MRKVRFTRYLLVVFLVGSLALVGFVLSRPRHASADKTFDIEDVRGRFISAENAYDASTVHAFANFNSSLVGPPAYFDTAEVLVADGEGNVCGASDGFYADGTNTLPPGINLGPSYFHGTYTVEPDGRITILTCADSDTPTAICTAANELIPCVAATAKKQVGYIQGEKANEIDTSEQVNAVFTAGGSFVSGNFSSGFLVHQHRWTKKAKLED